MLLSAAGIATLWLGMVLAIAMAARVKFEAPTLTREAGLDVGRHVFRAFGRVELFVFAVLAVHVALTPARITVVATGVLALVLAVQGAWLRPQLSRRAARLIAGLESSPSSLHRGYVSTEAIKLIALATLGMTT